MSSWGTRWRHFEGTALAWYARLVGHTARMTVEGEEHIAAALNADRPVLWAIWHGMLFPFITWGLMYDLDPRSFLIVIVGDPRGEVLAGMTRSIGGSFVTVDMQGNPVAGGRSVLNIIKALKAGKTSFILPDGPDGPAFEPKDGVFYIARKAQALVLPIGVWTRPAYHMPRWDRYQVPLPFSRFSTVVGNPLSVTRQTSEEQLRSQIPAALHAARDRAMVLSGVRPWR